MKNNVDIFVFGSSLSGRHDSGAALHAKNYYGAVDGQSAGLSGHSYAIPIKDARLRPLPLKQVYNSVRTLVFYAFKCQIRDPNIRFIITSLGCGLGGHTCLEIAPMFRGARGLDNVVLPDEFLEVLGFQNVR